MERLPTLTGGTAAGHRGARRAVVSALVLVIVLDASAALAQQGAPPNVLPAAPQQPYPVPQAIAPQQQSGGAAATVPMDAPTSSYQAQSPLLASPIPAGQPQGAVVPVSAQIPSPEAAGAGDVDTEARINALEETVSALKEKKYPLVRLSGFTQLDDGLTSQTPNARATLGDVLDGVGFRRARLQALGSLAEFTRFSVEFDFAVAGRPSFLDVWGEQSNLPFFDTVRIGHFRQPTTMDSLTSIRHLEFLERSAPFQALDPFRRVGIMAYHVTDDEMSTIAYSVYATGFTFWNATNNTDQYFTLGDTRFATQVGDSGGVSGAIRGTHLLYYDEPAEGRYLLHVGAGYVFSEVGGEGTTGPFAKTYQARSIPEFFVGDPIAAFRVTGGTPVVVDTGRILTNSFHFFHTELAGNFGSAHFQTEFLGTFANQFGGPPLFYYGAYLQAGYFLTGESDGYNKQTGVLDYNVKPYSEFFGTGTNHGICGWGAWEVAFRWSYLNLNANPQPGNVVDPTSPATNPSVSGNPPSPNPGVLNESTVALNWYWNQYTRVQFNWIHTMLENQFHGFSSLDIFASRFQIEF